MALVTEPTRRLAAHVVHRSSPGTIARTTLRVIGAGLLVAVAGIHLHLYEGGYRAIHVIGPLFLLNGVVGALAALAVLTVPRKVLPLVAVAGAMFSLGTIGGLVLSVTRGLFGFTESWRTPWAVTSVEVESAAAVVLTVLAVVAALDMLAGGRQSAQDGGMATQ